jgi:hypothetical protein
VPRPVVQLGLESRNRHAAVERFLQAFGALAERENARLLP